MRGIEVPTGAPPDVTEVEAHMEEAVTLSRR